jgi:hypothetical protein
MRTFREFILIAERYYEPNEKLPSGRTPMQKARDSETRQAIDYQDKSSSERTPHQAGRLNRQRDKIRTDVQHGADTKNFKGHDSDGYEVSSHKNQHLTVRHKDSGIEFTAKRSGKDYEGRDVHKISWSHHGNYSPDDKTDKMSDSEKRRVIKTAHHIYDTQFRDRLPHNSVVTNYPIENRNKKTGEKQEARRDQYARKGSAKKRDRYGYQSGIVGRPPSPKQAANGVQRIKPHQLNDYDYED